MARLNREHHRMLGNGYCVRPKTMDCQYENICESCTFFQTTIEFELPDSFRIQHPIESSWKGKSIDVWEAG